VALALLAAVAAGCSDARPPVGDGATPVTLAADVEPAEVPSDRRTLTRVDRLTGDMTPKSVVASGHGLVVAQNMIYTHTVSAFSSDGELVATIDDDVVPADHGYDAWTRSVQGGPVEAAFSRDGSQLWISNYSMYGPGFPTPGDDDCTPDSGVDPAFLYRIDPETFQVDDIVLVGAVPKYLEVTPDGRYVVVTNWCTWDASIVATGADGSPAREVARVPIGRYPRGVAISPDSATAYVAVMGGSDIAVVDIEAAVGSAQEGAQDEAAGDPAGQDRSEADTDADRSTPGAQDAVSFLEDVGNGPRHLVLSPDGTTLYATLNRDGTVAKVDAATGELLGTVRTGDQPRSAALSPDGTALFVVNYESDTVSRVRTSDLTEVETVAVDHHPIGITYDAGTDRVWVAAYGGSLTVFADGAAAP
jgi:YVTN family beta-propeller protein